MKDWYSVILLSFGSHRVQYRFNSTSLSHSSDRITLAKCSNSIECVLMGSNSSSKENSSDLFSQLKMILKALLISIIKCPPIGSWYIRKTNDCLISSVARQLACQLDHNSGSDEYPPSTFSELLITRSLRQISVCSLLFEFLYQTIQKPLNNYNFFFVQSLLYGCNGISSIKYADSTSCTQG